MKRLVVERELGLLFCIDYCEGMASGIRVGNKKTLSGWTPGKGLFMETYE